jgi:hypothetical protein
LLLFHSTGDCVDLLTRGRELRGHSLLLFRELGVQVPAASLPLGARSGGGLFTLRLGLRCHLSDFGMSGELGAPIDDQQDENQRTHGAQQHGQERKGRDLE